MVDTSSFSEKVLLVLLDKGALAILVLIFGFMGTRFIERYKAALATQEEFAKRRIEAAAAVCAKLELLRRILSSLHKSLIGEREWNAGSAARDLQVLDFSEEIRQLCEDIEAGFSNDFDQTQANLRNAVGQQDVTLSATLAESRYWLGNNLYRRCVESHAALLGWYKSLLDNNPNSMNEARRVADRKVIDLSVALREGSSLWGPATLLAVLIVGVSAILIYFW